VAGSCLLYLATVREESRIWSFNNSSSVMRFSPQVGFSAARRPFKSLISVVTRGLSTGLDFQRQKWRNAARCQPIKVAGLTITNALRQSNQRASFEIQTYRQAWLASLSSRVPEIEPTACARTDFPLPEPTAAPDISEETQTVTDDRAQVPNELGKPAEDVKHLCKRLMANSLISRADRIIT
jgi:hypothetical protein